MAGWNGGGGGLEGEGPTIPSLTMASQAEIIRNSTNERSRSTVVWKKDEHYMCTLVVECVQHRNRVFAPVYAVVAGTRQEQH